MKDLCVIIPCYNSERFIADRAREFVSVLSLTRWDWELLLSDDGSRDQTVPIIRRLAEELPRCRILESGRNRGRGANVREAMAQTDSRHVGFADSDYSTAAAYVVPAVLALEGGADVAVAHRHYKIRAAELPVIFHRLASHVAYAWLVEKVIGIRGHDTESGFKFFRREVVGNLLRATADAGWFWDTEIIAQAHAQGLTVAEIPSLFVRNPGMGSTVRLARDSWRQLRSLLEFRRRWRGVRFRGRCCR